MYMSPHHDHFIRWHEGERLDTVFEQTCDRLIKDGKGTHLAVKNPQWKLSYEELDQRANQFARYLAKKGIKSGDRVGLLFNKSAYTYIALLAVLKLNAAYVPLDAGFPKERISFIVDDANVTTIITLEELKNALDTVDVKIITIDEPTLDLEKEESSRLSDAEKGKAKEQLCYIIYTSGTTGNPKGVAIEHPSICNFVRVASEVYGIRQSDRMYQGMTIAFDFSVEELWVAFASGATLVPGQGSTNLVGNDLSKYLIENKVTALCCCPTLLATIEEDLPRLRFLLVSGEACPQNLVVRWHKKGRTFLNAYGPTEATVTATWTELHPDRPVTIGRPLPTYSVAILKADEEEELPDGEVGEICIGGIGLASGYLNRPDLTKKAFINDFLGLPKNPSNKIYRTGDLGRLNPDNQIEFLGRIDTQVKVRGYRIELTEIESIILQIEGIAQAVVDTYETEPGEPELVAYYSLTDENKDIDVADMISALKSALPSYMIPGYFEKLDVIPMLPSDKADRKKLPAPSGRKVQRTTGDFVSPSTPTELLTSEALAKTLRIDDVSIDDHFFDDLGSHSLLMAQFAAKLKTMSFERLGKPIEISMQEIYQNPTIKRLSELIDKSPLETKSIPENKLRRNEQHIASKKEYYLCGGLQIAYMLFFLTYNVAIGITLLNWVIASPSMTDFFLRMLGLGWAFFLVSLGIPFLAKKLLVGKWKEERIPIWSMDYLRFWLARSFMGSSIFVLFSGSPAYNFYLRLMGAKIGKNTVINTKFVPTCTDLIEIGDNCILQKDCYLTGYKAQDGYIYTGPVKLGDNVFVGQGTVLEINSSMGNDTQLGHTSSLQEQCHVPDGKNYHGSPAIETTTNYKRIEDPLECTLLRRLVYTLTLPVLGLFVFLPLVSLLIYWYLPHLFGPGKNLATIVVEATNFIELYTTNFIRDVSILSFSLLWVGLLLGLVWIGIMPRIFNYFLKENKTYVLFGFHYFFFTRVVASSNSKFFNLLFGDSSMIVHYLKYIGYKLGRGEQTGSNFGVEQKHDVPFSCEMGDETLVSDGLSMMNAEFTNSSFRISRTKIGGNSFLGNNIFYPTGGRTGENCLLATKVMIPLDGKLRENVGLLGSPCFEIPRAVRRDTGLDKYPKGPIRSERLKKKNVANFITVMSYLMVLWFYGTIALFVGIAALLAYGTYGMGVFILTGFSMLFFTIGYFALIERWSLGFKKLKPQFCSIYDTYYWKHEHYWKLMENPLVSLFAGTPFKNMISRLLGVKIGKQVFDDGMVVTEKSLVEIGDYCTFNKSATLQAHSLEEGVFKSDYIKIENKCSFGIASFIHYGVHIHDNVHIDADSFLMKGSECNDGSTWRGNPAKVISTSQAIPELNDNSAMASIIEEASNLNDEFVEAAE